MRKPSRFFVFLLLSGLCAAYAPLTQADMRQQGYGNTTIAPIMRPPYAARHHSYGSKVGFKALNAFANLTTAPLEIPKNIINTTNNSNIIYGAVGGLFKGLIHMGGRIGVGVADLVTIPLPTQPIAYPPYIWEDFDVDTSYGPVFRLDSDYEEDAPVVQAPAPKPVVAPPVVQPKPQPIDASKQFRIETNHNLDQMFKKEMKK